MKKVLFIVANIGFQDDEFSIPFTILTSQGFECTIASGKGGRCRGGFFKIIEKSLALDEVQASDFDILVFVGGGGAYVEYYQEPRYLNLARNAKAVAAICIAPTLVSDAGIIEGKKVTGWDDGAGTQLSYLKNNGGIVQDQDVVQDGNLITANGPLAATKFAWKIVDYLVQRN